MVVKIPFNYAGQTLWINVQMFGIYFVSYTYQLWSAIQGEPPVLTNPIKSGNNAVPHDDFFPVINDYNPTDPIAKYQNRIIDVRFWIKKGNVDNGYNVDVTVLQGNVIQTAQVLGHDSRSGNVGSLSIKQEFITIQLV